MKFSRSWLDEFSASKVDTSHLAEQLTLAGLEVAKVNAVAPQFSGVIVGEVVAVDTHPNATKLTVCRVNIGSDSPLTIVCGAQNVRTALKVPVALVGAQLPNNIVIKKVKLRGVESAGMLCAAAELGCTAAGSGIWELPPDAPIGKELREYLLLDDTTITIELTPNRGDCLSIIGIAREVAAINRLVRHQIKWPTIKTQGDSLPVTLRAPAVCPHYCGRIIRGINNSVTTPLWLQERLRRADIAPINPVVDVTNYVMVELGQPLHAFALTQVAEEIQVRYAKAEEELTLLNGKTVALKSTTLVIADKDRPLALAGVMGGLAAGVKEDSTAIFLESAFFVPEQIAGVARSYNLQTESSYRYERGVDYNLQLLALERATELLLQIVGGVPAAYTEVTVSEKLPAKVEIFLRPATIERVLGISIAASVVVDILSYLEMAVATLPEGWKVVIPSWRFDLKIEEDLVEEIARIYGYHRIPEQKVVAELVSPPGTTNNIGTERLEELMVDLGYHEIITYSFTEPRLEELLTPQSTALPLLNPIAPELGVMRSSLWPGLIKVAQYNLQRQQQRLRLFEIGLRFFKSGGELQQLLTLAGIAVGELFPPQWGIKQHWEEDFFAIKNDVSAVLKLSGYTDAELSFLPSTMAALHPKRSAQLKVGKLPLGYLGELHPKVKQELELSGSICLFEIDLSNIGAKKQKTLPELSKFPKSQRDIAIIIRNEIKWQQIKEEILDISGNLLQNVDIFDIYQEKNIGADNKSIAIRLVFQSVERTLVDHEIDALVGKIVAGLQKKFNAILRG